MLCFEIFDKKQRNKNINIHFLYFLDFGFRTIKSGLALQLFYYFNRQRYISPSHDQRIIYAEIKDIQ